MGFENYDLIWGELEAVMKKYGYQLVVLHNDPKSVENPDDTIRATFVKEDDSAVTCVSCNHFGVGCESCKGGEDD